MKYHWRRDKDGYLQLVCTYDPDTPPSSPQSTQPPDPLDCNPQSTRPPDHPPNSPQITEPPDPWNCSPHITETSDSWNCSCDHDLQKLETPSTLDNNDPAKAHPESGPQITEPPEPQKSSHSLRSVKKLEQPPALENSPMREDPNCISHITEPPDLLDPIHGRQIIETLEPPHALDESLENMDPNCQDDSVQFSEPTVKVDPPRKSHNPEKLKPQPSLDDDRQISVEPGAQQHIQTGQGTSISFHMTLINNYRPHSFSEAGI